MSVANVVKEAIESFAPRENAEDWDNTGILIESNSEAKRILLTIDLTEDVLQEGIDRKVGVIVAYHPVIFKPIKSIADSRYIRCIRNNIAVYSPHTQLDGLMNKYILDFIGPNPGNIDDIARRLASLAEASIFRVVRSKVNHEYKNDGDIRVGVGAAFRGVCEFYGLIITGEMSHHDILACKRNGTAVILMEHSVSERFFLKELKNMMKESGLLGDHEIYISQEDRDPVEYAVFGKYKLREK